RHGEIANSLISHDPDVDSVDSVDSFFQPSRLPAAAAAADVDPVDPLDLFFRPLPPPPHAPEGHLPPPEVQAALAKAVQQVRPEQQGRPIDQLQHLEGVQVGEQQ